MSPILVRPVREQLEHDRLVRLLQTKSRRRYDAAINPGAEQNTPVKSGTSVVYPDVLLFSPDRARRLQGIIEVETGESVNHLEALAQWVPFGKLRVPLILYVPANMSDVARRLCEDNQIQVSELWSYHHVGDEFRFTLMHRTREAVPEPRAPRRPAVKDGVKDAVKNDGAKNDGVKSGGVKNGGVKNTVKKAARPTPAPSPKAPPAKASPAKASSAKPAKNSKPAAKPTPAVKPARAAKPVTAKPVGAKSVNAKPANAKPANAKPANKARPQKRR